VSEETPYSKNRFHGLWALTNRDLKKWYQNPIVFIIGIVQPILWLTLLGKAMNMSAIIPTGIPGVNPSAVMQQMFGTSDYFSYMAMGMVAFTVVFTSAFVGISVVFDRRLGFMNKVLSTPVSRSVIITSKVLSASIRSMFQAAIVTGIAYVLGLQLGTNFNAFSILGIFAIVFLIGFGLSSMFTAITLRTTRMETPQAIFNLVTLPLMFASSAYFPISKMPDWLQVIANVNPISYTIDAVRRLMIFSDGYDKLPLDFAFVGIFAIVVTSICVALSWRYLNK
jgi:ABC-2 type transport system permease protein